MTDQTSSQAGQPIDIDWAGKGSNYVGIGFKVFFLKIITLGIYHFWGKTEVRRKLWNHVRINGEPLEYTGKGMELFLGFLIVMACVLIPIPLIFFGIATLFGPESPVLIGFFILLYLVFFYLIGVAIYAAQRYRLSRTQWRGIRGALKGSAWNFGLTTFWTTLVTIVTLGLAIPWQSIKLHKIMTENTYFGETPMRFTGKTMPIFKSFIFTWVVVIGLYGLLLFILYPTIQQMEMLQKSGEIIDPARVLMINLKIFGSLIIFGLAISIAYAWYQSKYYNYTTEHTHFSNGSFNLTTTPGGLIWITISNFFIVILTLGILSPVAIARFIGYFVNNLSFNGNIDIAAIHQSQQELSKTGEGLAEGFDISSF